MTEDQFRQLLEQNNAQLVARFDERLEEKNTGLFGQLSQHFDARFDTLRDELKAETERIYRTVDGIAKRLDTDEQERAAITVEQERQNKWINQLAQATNAPLIPEQ